MADQVVLGLDHGFLDDQEVAYLASSQGLWLYKDLCLLTNESCSDLNNL